MTYITFIDSPMGKIGVAAADGRLTRIFFDISGLPDRWQRKDDEPTLTAAAKQLTEYFNGARQAFELPVTLDLTEFERRVLAQTAEIPCGETMTYGQLAAALGKPGAARAVGNALRKNPLPIVIPCHRVVGANGALTGYAYGLQRKQFLLAHEKKFLP
ncbi:MAG: methylated-DNA--[Clostridia bacterium]|nr:methylated-DNA--[protein]-cysteine S-methyltransferase [Clostridia bacterium]